MTVIAIDGKAGTGKSTMAKRLAKHLGFFCLDTGALYRCASHFLVERKIHASDALGVEEALKDFHLEILRKDADTVQYLLNGVDVSTIIRTPEVEAVVSDYAKMPAVRSSLLHIQRKAAQNMDLVAEGRDMGTVVFKDAEVKFFFDASVQVRAERRFAELKDKGLLEEGTTVQSVCENLQKRDHIDKSRALSPLKVAEDAIVIDTSTATQDEVFAKLLHHLQKRN